MRRRVSRIAHWLWILFLGVVAFEVLLYVLRRYEVVSSGEPAGLRRGLLNVAGSFFVQCAATLAMLILLPFSLVWPFSRRAGDSRPPVVCVHGYAGSRANFLVLAWRLRRDGFGAVHGVNYPSLGGTVLDKARRLSGAVERIAREAGAERVDLVAHSLGGLVSRAYIREYGGGARVRRLVTLGTPHQGTRTAALALDGLARSMLPGSRFLVELGREDPVPTLTSVTSIFSTFDAKVLPHRNGRYPGASNIEVDGIGHDALLFSPKVYVLVREALEAPDRQFVDA